MEIHSPNECANARDNTSLPRTSISHRTIPRCRLWFSENISTNSLHILQLFFLPERLNVLDFLRNRLYNQNLLVNLSEQTFSSVCSIKTVINFQHTYIQHTFSLSQHCIICFMTKAAFDNFQINEYVTYVCAFTYWVTSSLEAILPSTMRCTMCQWSSSVRVSRHTSGVAASFDVDPTSCSIHGCSMMSARLARWLGSRTSIFRIMLQCTT